MNEVVVTVRGEQQTRTAPERAVVSLTIRAEGPRRGEVVERISELSRPVVDDLESRLQQDGVAEWSSRHVAVWSDRPWSPDGKRLAPVHYASVDVTAVFTDFAALSWWVGEVAERDGVEVSGVAWELTPATRTALERDVAAEAVGVAVARATAYARALGLVNVTPLQVADVGLLESADPGSQDERPGPGLRMMAMAADAGSPGVDLRPADIVITSAVEARFSAR